MRFSGKEQETVEPHEPRGLGPADTSNPTRNLVVSDNWAVTPSVLNEFRFGYTTSDITSVTGLIGTRLRGRTPA